LYLFENFVFFVFFVNEIIFLGLTLVIFLRTQTGEHAAFQTMDSKVHFCQADGGGGFFLTEKSDTPHSVHSFVLDEMVGLHEHAAGTAG
jgi:hypothetical protein